MATTHDKNEIKHFNSLSVKDTNVVILRRYIDIDKLNIFKIDNDFLYISMLNKLNKKLDKLSEFDIFIDGNNLFYTLNRCNFDKYIIENKIIPFILKYLNKQKKKYYSVIHFIMEKILIYKLKFLII
jgi:hypothetical protein